MSTRSKTRRLLAVALMFICAPRCWSETADERYRLAAGYYSTGEWQMAIDQFEVYLAKHPAHPYAQLATFYYGEALVQVGDFKRARAAFQQFATQQPNHEFTRRATFRAAESAYLSSQDEIARRDLELFFEEYPDDELNQFVLSYLGELALTNNDASTAEKWLQEALTRYPSGRLADQCRLGLGRAFELSGNTEQALRFYGYLANNRRGAMSDTAALRIGLLQFNQQDYVAAERSLQSLVERTPKPNCFVEASYWLGQARVKQANWSQAAEAMKAALPDAKAHKLAAPLLFGIADARQRSGESALAEQRYKQLLDEHADSAWADDAMQTLSAIWLAAERYDDVETLAAEFEQRYADSPLLTRMRESQGRAQMARGKYTAAANTFKRLVERESGADASPGEIARWTFLQSQALLADKQLDQAATLLAALNVKQAEPSLTSNILAARATTFFAVKRYAEAIEAQRAYLSVAPDGVDAAQCRAQLVVGLAQLGKILDAEAALLELKSRHPQDALLPTTIHLLAEAAYDQQQWPVAVKHFRMLQQCEDPQLREKALSGLAWSLRKMGKQAEAAEAFTELSGTFPEGEQAAEAMLMKARSLEEQQRADEAILAYERFASEYPQSDYADDALLAAARLHQQAGGQSHQQAAVALLEQVLADYPQRNDRDRVLYELGWLQLDLRQEQDAAQYFQTLHEKHQASRFWADATFRLAEHASRQGDLKRAESLAATVAASDASGTILLHALYMQGQLAAQGGRWQDAAAVMKRLVAEFPDSELVVPAMYWRAESLYRQGRLAEALGAVDATLARSKNSRESWLSTIWLRRAQILLQQKEWGDAFQAAEDAAERFPQFEQMFEIDYVRGRCMAMRARFTDAREAYQRVLAAEASRGTETAAKTQWMIGETYFHQKKLDEAVAAYHRAFSLHDYPEWQAAALFQAGKCLELQSQPTQALARYRQVVEKFPESKYSEMAASRVAALNGRTSAKASTNN